jgi:hypothetical protein
MASRNCHGRQLKWSICLSDQVADLEDPWLKLMFTWMIPTVDNLGRMEGEPYQVKGIIFPKETSVTIDDVERMLAELHDAGLIIWYRHGRLRYVFLPKHHKHQRLAGNMRKESDFPAPHEADERLWRESEEARRTTFEHDDGVTVTAVQTLSERGSDAVRTPCERRTSLREEKGREETHLSDIASESDPAEPEDSDVHRGVRPRKGVEHPQSAASIRARETRTDGERAFLYWVEVMGKQDDTQYDGERRAKCDDRLKKDSTLGDIRQAIDGCHASPHNMGENDRHRRFNDLELICRSRTKLEEFMAVIREKTTAAGDPWAILAKTDIGTREACT